MSQQLRFLEANKKGGVAKTTTTINASIMSTLCGKNTLAIDLESSANLTYAFGYTPGSLKHTIYTLMRNQSRFEDVLLPTYYDPRTGIFFDPTDESALTKFNLSSLDDAARGPDLLPNSMLSSEADTELQTDPLWGSLLERILNRYAGSYAEMHMDSGPNVGKQTVCGIYAANFINIVLVPESWPTQGMIDLAQAIAHARGYLPELAVAGLFYTRYKYAEHKIMMQLIAEQLLPELNALFPGIEIIPFETYTTERKEYTTVTKERSTIITGAPTSIAALDYWRWYVELMNRCGGEGLARAIEYYKQAVTLNEEKKPVGRKKKVRNGETKA